jgi:hypothetical protein
MSHFPPKGQVLLVSDGSISNGVYTQRGGLRIRASCR